MQLPARLAVFLAFVLVPVARGASLAQSVLQPYERASPDGRWTLSVDPTRRDGGGPGNYRCSHDGEIAWEGEKPWAFWDALITNEGFVAGASYSQDGVRMFAGGEFHVVILAPDGTKRLDEAHARTGSRFIHAPSDPQLAGLLEQPEQRRVVFRIEDEDINRRHEEWWCFQLPDAREVYRRRPNDAFPAKDARDHIFAAREIAGSDLMLVEWRVFAWPKIGLAFSLLDPAGKVQWDLVQSDELPGFEDAAFRPLLAMLHERGSLVETTKPLTFAIGLPRSEQRIDFALERVAQGWKVSETGRVPWKLATVAPRESTLADVSEVQLQRKGKDVLECGPAAANAVHDICAFDFASAESLRIVRGNARSGRVALLRVDSKGGVQHEVQVELPGARPNTHTAYWNLGARVWLATQRPETEASSSGAWRIDEESGVATRLDAFACASIDDVAPLGLGRFVALATRHERSTSRTGLFAFDADGRALWSKVEAHENTDPGALLSPEAIAVTLDGTLGVLDVIRHTLQCFGADGEYRRTIDLDRAIGHKANYPSGLRADVGNGFLVRDFKGTPPLFRLDREGAMRGSVSPRFGDGKVVDGLTRHARVAPDGRIWATDGQRLFRLDEQGAVDLELGARMDVDVLAQPCASSIDVFGRALVQDEATGAVHVFDGHGHRLFVCRPLPTDCEDPSSIADLAATRERGVTVPRKDGFVQFGSDGARLSLLDGLKGKLVVSPITGTTYLGCYSAGFVALDAERKPGAKFERGPERRMLVGDEPAIAIDGAIGLVDGGSEYSARGPASLVLFETADPSVSKRWPLPSDAERANLALGRHWAAVSGWGKSTLLVNRTDGRLARFVLPDADEGKNCKFGFDPETDELLVLEGNRTLHRFALPPSGPR